MAFKLSTWSCSMSRARILALSLVAALALSSGALAQGGGGGGGGGGAGGAGSGAGGASGAAGTTGNSGGSIRDPSGNSVAQPSGGQSRPKYAACRVLPSLSPASHLRPPVRTLAPTGFTRSSTTDRPNEKKGFRSHTVQRALKAPVIRIRPPVANSISMNRLRRRRRHPTVGRTAATPKTA